jgi:hypothetical protein
LFDLFVSIQQSLVAVIAPSISLLGWRRLHIAMRLALSLMILPTQLYHSVFYHLSCVYSLCRVYFELAAPCCWMFSNCNWNLFECCTIWIHRVRWSFHSIVFVFNRGFSVYFNISGTY